MWQCRKCGRPVYFAERKQSLGFDWHPNCLRCEECGKRLNPGQHAEHKGVPYCHHPCYGALFGPQLFGHGTRNECHTSFGKVENRDGQVKRSHIEAKLKAYNQYYEGKPGELKSREANGRMILEGVLKIYWGVRNVIHLKEEDDQRTIAVRRRSTTNSAAFYSDSDDEEQQALWRDDCLNGWRTPQSPSSPQTPKVSTLGRSTLFCVFPDDQALTERENAGPLTPGISTDGVLLSREDGAAISNRICGQPEMKDQTPKETPTDLNNEGDLWKNTDFKTCNMNALLDIGCRNSSNLSNGVSRAKEENMVNSVPQSDDTSSGNTKHKNSSSEVMLNNNASSYSSEPLFDNENSNPSVLENSESGELNTSLDDHTPSKRVAMKTGSSAIRRRPGRRMDKTKLKRRCSINGHFYLRETSSFTPPHGSPCSVWVTSLVTAEEVLNMLLEKYRVEMSTRNFALYVIKDNGERRRIRDDEYPLITRVMLGPHEDVARVFIVDAQQTEEISPQVAEFLNLSLAECRAILRQYEQEELRQIHALRQKYEDMAFYIQRRMKELRGV